MPWRSALRPLALAALVGVAALLAGIVAEAIIIRSVHGDRQKLEWLSDVAISTGVAGLAYLWLRLRAARTRLLALERDQIVLDEQLRLAGEIQRNLLPAVPDTTPGFRWAAQMVPAGHIGGDFYDFIRVSDDVALAILCDVSGKGIPAALILSSLKTLFRTFAQETADPGLLAERLSAALHEEHAGLPYATAIIARFEASPARIGYVNAGHPSGYLLRDGTATAALESGGPPLGLLPGTTYATAEVRLQPGDVGVLVTDGVSEALGGGAEQLQQVLTGALDGPAGRSPSELCTTLLQVSSVGPGPAGAAHWQDDRTVLAFAVETTD